MRLSIRCQNFNFRWAFSVRLKNADPFYDLFLCDVFKHVALSEYRPILTSSPASHSLSSMADRKFTLIPMIFIMLRMWSTIRFLLLLTHSHAGHNPVLVTLHVSHPVPLSQLEMNLIYSHLQSHSCGLFVYFIKVIYLYLPLLHLATHLLWFHCI